MLTYLLIYLQFLPLSISAVTEIDRVIRLSNHHLYSILQHSETFLILDFYSIANVTSSSLVQFKILT